jgi:excinuclease UvrABC nuclease subunit
MKKFGSFQKMREATAEELSKTPGINLDLAMALLHALSSQ